MNEMHTELVTLAFEAGYFTGAGEHWNRLKFANALTAFIVNWGTHCNPGERVQYVLANRETFIGEDARLAVRELFEGVLK